MQHQSPGSGKNPGMQKRIMGPNAKNNSIKKLGEKGLRKEHLCYKFTGSWLPGANHATPRMNYKN